MEFKNFIDTCTNNLDVFKKNHFKIIKKRNLILVKYIYDRPNFDYIWDKYCKGIIYDNNNKEIICIPPTKSDSIDKLYSYKNYVIQHLIDGTMINMFYYDNKWTISTRSDIGGKNRWNNNTMEYMFKQCCDYYNLCNSLNKKNCYSFVMNHKSIRNVSNVLENKITLVEEYDLSTLCRKNTFTDLPCEKVKTIELSDNQTLQDLINEYLENNKNNIDFKGLTIKNLDDNSRISIVNPEYNNVKNKLCINTDNLLFKFVQTQKNKNLHEYINLYPEHKTKFTEYSNIYNTMCVDCLSTYHDLFVHKIIEKKNVKYQLNPIIYKLHEMFIKTNKYIDKKIVNEYITTLDCARIVFVMKYYI
tara:strand:- start:1265 stop:2341 length:1077 start_codon:yes stop_codon:yes gene_type:complete